MIAALGPLFVRMLRVRVAITMWTFMLLGVARHGGPTVSWELALATVALAASYVTATTLNDIHDLEIDRANGLGGRGRPLMDGSATVADLRVLNRTAAGMALVVALPLGATGVAVVVTSLLVSYAYSGGPLRLSRRWSLAPFVLAFAYVVIPYTLGVAIAGDRLSDRDVPLVAGLFVLFLARIILKDFRDRVGDDAHGKKTLLLRIGKPATCALSIAGATIGSAILVGGVGSPPVIVASMSLFVLGIDWMLVRLAAIDDARLEQVAIGTAARAGNGLLIAALAWLLLTADGADPRTASIFLILLTAVLMTSFVSLALHPERVRIGYKA